jgi:hypothetical protein
MNSDYVIVFQFYCSVWATISMQQWFEQIDGGFWQELESLRRFDSVWQFSFETENLYPHSVIHPMTSCSSEQLFSANCTKYRIEMTKRGGTIIQVNMNIRIQQALPTIDCVMFGFFLNLIIWRGTGRTCLTVRDGHSALNARLSDFWTRSSGFRHLTAGSLNEDNRKIAENWHWPSFQAFGWYLAQISRSFEVDPALNRLFQWLAVCYLLVLHLVTFWIPGFVCEGQQA